MCVGGGGSGCRWWVSAGFHLECLQPTRVCGVPQPVFAAHARVGHTTAHASAHRCASVGPRAPHTAPPPDAPVGLGRGGALNQVVAVDGGGHHGLGQPGGDELQHGHLRGRILHGHAVCMGRWGGTQSRLLSRVPSCQGSRACKHDMAVQSAHTSGSMQVLHGKVRQACSHRRSHACLSTKQRSAGAIR